VRKPLSDAALLKILETANERDLFIVGHMYIENTINQILEKKFGVPSKSIDSTLFTLNLKMDILIESGLIKGNVKKNVELLAELGIDMLTNWSQMSRGLAIISASCNIWDLHQNRIINTQSIGFA